MALPLTAVGSVQNSKMSPHRSSVPGVGAEVTLHQTVWSTCKCMQCIHCTCNDYTCIVHIQVYSVYVFVSFI